MSHINPIYGPILTSSVFGAITFTLATVSWRSGRIPQRGRPEIERRNRRVTYFVHLALIYLHAIAWLVVAVWMFLNQTKWQ